MKRRTWRKFQLTTVEGQLGVQVHEGSTFLGYLSPTFASCDGSGALLATRYDAPASECFQRFNFGNLKAALLWLAAGVNGHRTDLERHRRAAHALVS